jgi:hypothetical protein
MTMPAFKPVFLLSVLSSVVSGPTVVMAFAKCTPVSESLQLHQNESRRDESYAITPPFTDYVLPIKLPFTLDPDAFQSTLFSVMCG